MIQIRCYLICFRWIELLVALQEYFAKIYAIKCLGQTYTFIKVPGSRSIIWLAICVQSALVPWHITPSNGNIFRVTGPLWWESTGRRWIPLTKARDAELWCFISTNGWANDRDAGDLRCRRTHYGVTAMGTEPQKCSWRSGLWPDTSAWSRWFVKNWKYPKKNTSIHPPMHTFISPYPYLLSIHLFIHLAN